MSGEIDVSKRLLEAVAPNRLIAVPNEDKQFVLARVIDATRSEVNAVPADAPGGLMSASARTYLWSHVRQLREPVLSQENLLVMLTHNNSGLWTQRYVRASFRRKEANGRYHVIVNGTERGVPEMASNVVQELGTIPVRLVIPDVPAEAAVQAALVVKRRPRLRLKKRTRPTAHASSEDSVLLDTRKQVARGNMRLSAQLRKEQKPQPRVPSSALAAQYDVPLPRLALRAVPAVPDNIDAVDIDAADRDTSVPLTQGDIAVGVLSA
ncbi:MAG: hypothetical protein MHM6MM_003027 [Cercozoa sp. M6MM]